MTTRAIHEFCLYVAGDSQNSVRALANLNSFCRAHLPDCHRIEVVDVFREPKRALAERIFMTPTLVKVSPAPVCRIMGTLSHLPTLLEALGLDPLPA